MQFLDAISMQAPSAALAPIAKARVRKVNHATPVRWSQRLATISSGSSSVQRAQAILMKKLGIIAEQDPMTPQDLDAYAMLFDHPLFPAHIAALTSLFHWTVPDDWDRSSLERA